MERVTTIELALSGKQLLPELENIHLLRTRRLARPRPSRA